MVGFFKRRPLVSRKSALQVDIGAYSLIHTTNTLFCAAGPSYVPHHDPPELPSFSSSPRINRSERWDSSHTGDRAGAAAFLNVHANNPPLCRRCRQSTGERPELGGSKSCEDCKNDPELAHVAQNAALGLSQLAATLSSGVSSQQRAAIGIGLEVRGCGFKQAYGPPLNSLIIKPKLTISFIDPGLFGFR